MSDKSETPRELIRQECAARGVSRQAPCCSDRCDGYSNAAEHVIARLQQWVLDLQDGGYVNCVYCGKQYGKQEDGAPVALADHLKAHIEECSNHPMSALKRERDEALKRLAEAEAKIQEIRDNATSDIPSDLIDWMDGFLSGVQS